MRNLPNGGVYAYTTRAGAKGWRVVWFEPDPTLPKGYRRREQRVPSVSRAEAQRIRALRSSRAALEGAGMAMRAERVTLRDWWLTFIADRKASGAFKPSTLALYERHWRLYIHTLGEFMLAALTLHVVRSWLDALRRHPGQASLPGIAGPKPQGKLGPRALAGVYSTLRTIVRAAAEESLFGDPAHFKLAFIKAAPKRAPHTERRRLRGAEFGALLDAAAQEGARHEAAMVILAFAGGRRGELPHLEWGKHVRVAVVGDVPTAELIFEGEWTKSRTTRRGTVTGRPALVLLRWAQMTGGTGFVFARRSTMIRTGKAGRKVYEKGAPLTRPVGEGAWARIRAAVGAEGMRLHDLRGSFATHLLASGMNPSDVQKLLGHANLKTTLGYLAEARDPDRAAAAAHFDAVAGGEDWMERAAKDAAQLDAAAVRALGDAMAKDLTPTQPALPAPAAVEPCDYGARLKSARMAKRDTQADLAVAVLQAAGTGSRASWQKAISKLERAKGRLWPEIADAIGQAAATRYGDASLRDAPSRDPREQAVKASKASTRSRKRRAAAAAEVVDLSAFRALGGGES